MISKQPYKSKQIMRFYEGIKHKALKIKWLFDLQTCFCLFKYGVTSDFVAFECSFGIFELRFYFGSSLTISQRQNRTIALSLISLQ